MAKINPEIIPNLKTPKIQSQAENKNSEEKNVSVFDSAKFISNLNPNDKNFFGIAESVVILNKLAAANEITKEDRDKNFEEIAEKYFSRGDLMEFYMEKYEFDIDNLHEILSKMDKGEDLSEKEQFILDKINYAYGDVEEIPSDRAKSTKKPEENKQTVLETNDKEYDIMRDVLKNKYGIDI